MVTYVHIIPNRPIGSIVEAYFLVNRITAGQRRKAVEPRNSEHFPSQVIALWLSGRCDVRRVVLAGLTNTPEVYTCTKIRTLSTVLYSLPNTGGLGNRFPLRPYAVDSHLVTRIRGIVHPDGDPIQLLMVTEKVFFVAVSLNSSVSFDLLA